MSLEPLPHGLGEFSVAMTDDSSLASLWPLPPTLQDLHFYQSVEEVKQSLAAVTAELQATREEVRQKEQNIASLVEQVRRTVQERDLLRQQHHLLLAREVEASQASATLTACPLPSSSSPVAVNRAAMIKPFQTVPSSVNADRRSRPEVPTLTTLYPVVVDRVPMINPLAVPSYAAIVADDRRSTAAAVEVPSFAALAGEDRSKVAALELLAARRPLPQQGRLVQAVMEAGPLLQHLLVAGPLPRWRNPPPRKALADAMISVPSGSGAPMGLPWSIH